MPHALFRILTAGVLLVASGVAHAQHIAPKRDKPPAAEPVEAPAPSAAVARLLNQDYLTDSERSALRVRFGLWEDADLSDARARAKAALTRGALEDESLRDENVPALDRAEASAHRGEFDAALALLGEDLSPRAVHLRAASLAGLGRMKDADEAIDALGNVQEITDPDEVVAAVRALMLRARLRGPQGAEGADFKAMMFQLARAREELDKLSWPAYVAEAVLLDDKDNGPEAGPALETALSLNPRSADAWYLLGRMAVDGFDIARAEQIGAKLTELGDTARGAMVLARARMRLSDTDAAIAVLDGQIAKFPMMRDLLALRAAASAAAFDYTDADKRLAELDALTPGSAEAWLIVGHAVSEARQYDEASRYLGEAAKREPNWPEPIIELGLLEMQSGHDAAALTALEAAAKLDTFNIRAANSLTLVRELKTYASVTSAHFEVRYKPGQDEVLAREMLAPLERIHDRVTGNQRGGIDHDPQEHGQPATVIELMPDHHWFSVRITGMPRIHTIAAATGPVVAMEAPRDGPGHLVGPYDWQRVVQHEYTHTVTLSRTRNRLPHWFTEAAAVYLEDHPRDYSTIQMLARASANDELFDFDTINIAFVRPEKPTDRGLAYAQGHWMYEYMIVKYGPRTPLDLMDRYAAGEREANAFKAVMGVDRAQFLTDFKCWAHEQLVAWGMALPEGVPSIKDLLVKEAKEGEDAPDEATSEMVEKWLALYPRHPDLLKLAVQQRLDANSGKPDAAMVSQLERYIEARPVDPLPHKLLARLFLDSAGSSLGQGPEAAIEHLEFLDAREQHSASYATELSRRYAAAGQMDKAMLKADRAVCIAPYDATTREFAAAIAIRAGDLDAAERHIRALTILEPDRPVHKQRLDAIQKKRAEPK